MRILKYYNDPLKANIDRERLEAEGIKAVVLNEHSGIVIPLSGAIPSLRPHLAVAEEDSATAAEILGLRLAEVNITVCPKCGSADLKLINSGSRLRRSLKRIFSFFTLAFMASSQTPLYDSFRCRRCRQEFRQ